MADVFAYLDQLRYMGGTLLILFLVCDGALPRRTGYPLRASLACTVACAAALAYVPLAHLIQSSGYLSPLAILPYWSVMAVVPIIVVYECFETNLAGALFRALVAIVTENMATVLLRYLLVLCLFPELQDRPLVYVAVMVADYVLVYGAAYALMWRRIRVDESGLVADPRIRAWRYALIYLAFSLVLALTKVVCEDVIVPFSAIEGQEQTFIQLRLFLVFVMIAVGVVVGAGIVNDHEAIVHAAERETTLLLARERAAQYEFSRENIDMINRKAHDLKHQIGALERVGEEEAARRLGEISQAVGFYDAVVRTGNEALDTLLTEKSVYCANRGIRFSCTVQSERLSDIALVDLYTLLGNAIDNAIEAVEQLEDESRKTISLSARDRGTMLVIQIENYFDGSLEMVDGLPKTSKGDTLSHGYGVRSMRSIAQRYGGDLSIKAEDGTFSLVILIP